MSFISRRLALLATLVLLGGCVSPAVTSGLASGFPPPPGSGYQLQGTAVYENKPLLGLSAEFDQLAVSPSGSRVVFRGREALEDYRLFISEIDGAIRSLAKTAQEPQRFAWTSDESALFFLTVDFSRDGLAPDAPPDAPPAPSGHTLWRMNVATGEQKALVSLPGNGACFPSPDGRHVLLSGFVGFGVGKNDGGLMMLDVETGVKTPIAPDISNLYTVDAARWRPDGQAIAVVGTRGNKPDDQLTVFTAPGWERVDHEALAWSSGYVHLRWPSQGNALDAYLVGANGALERRRYGAGPSAPETVRFPVPGLTTGRQLTYENMWPSQDGDRVVMLPALSSPSPDNDNPFVSRRPLVSDLPAQAFRDLQPGQTPIAWLDASRMLVLTVNPDNSQQRRLAVITP